MDDPSKSVDDPKKISSLLPNSLLRQAEAICARLTRNPGIHSVNALEAVGFRYTDVGDTARCDTCGLEVSNWPTSKSPFTIHSERSPDCEFVRYIKSSNLVSISSASPVSRATLNRSLSESNEDENPSKRQKSRINNEKYPRNRLLEMETLKQVRRRTFSHWPHRTSPSRAHMIEAGFFHCNVADRVICLYCDLICEKWILHADDPSFVHKTLSPQCPFVISMVVPHEATSISPISPTTLLQVVATSDQFRSNIAYIEIPQRHESFATWPEGPSPLIDDLVRAGFFYTGTQTIVTCFNCNGSLQNWGPNDNPIVEHARWFPHCAHAKQLCGDDLYRQIQASQQTIQAHVPPTESTNDWTAHRQKLQISDRNTLASHVAARLDLPNTQRLLHQGFKLFIIKRCWENQLRIKKDDFVTDCDLYTACIILQKQMERIGCSIENIIIPSKRMREIREREQAEALAWSSSIHDPAAPVSTHT